MLKKVVHTIPRAIAAGIVGLIVTRIVRRRREAEHHSFVHRLLAH